MPTTSQARQQNREIAKQIVRRYFRDDKGLPFELTDGQADIFNVIFIKDHQRVQVIASTQYGKSSTVAMALIVRSQAFHEQFAIVTGSEPKSQIIMEKVIQHSFDHEQFYSQLELDPNEPLDKLRRTRNKRQVTWKGGGGIRTFTADSRNRQRVKESLTGFGSPNIIEDESALIPDDLQSMVMRMLGGQQDSFLLKIGNPFYRNHFHRTWNNGRYFRIFIDYVQALRENRYSEAFIEEMRNEAFFDILYACQFPEEDEVNEQGWRKLVTDSDLERAYEDAELQIPRPVGRPRLGVDIAAGGSNYTTFVLRYDNYMRLLEKNRDPDLMAQVGRIEGYMKEYEITSTDVTVDDSGVGHGVGNRLAERNIVVNTFKGGTTAYEKDSYANLRAEAYWLLGQWVKGGGKIVKTEEFYQISLINYKPDSASRVKIEPKEELGKRGIASPDIADAASMTFSNTVAVTANDVVFM
jgi:hypothetical protein